MFLDHTSSPPGQPHSIYASLAAFAVACFVLTLMTDLAYWASASITWETMSVWLLTIGLIVASLAILGGIVDVVRSRKIRGLGQPKIVVVGHVVAFVLSIVNVFVHSRDGYTAVVPEGLGLSILVVLVLAVTTVMGRAAVAATALGVRS